MINNGNVHDTLFLVIKEEDGVVAEYQRQLYEASLLGIDRVMYCLVCNSNENIKRSRIDDSLEKLDMTCDILKMQLLNKTIIVWDSFAFGKDSMIIKTNDEGFIISSIACVDYFDCYKAKNSDMLQTREKVGKVLAKGVAQKYSLKKVSSVAN